MTGWRAALRLARRDALRHKANSLLVLILIALPVLAVTAAAVVWETRDVDSHEALERRLGASAALVESRAGAVDAFQAFDPRDNSGWSSTSDDEQGAPTKHHLAQVRGVLGDVPAVVMARSTVEVVTDRGRTSVEVTEVDLANTLTEGLFRLESGRVPTRAGEVVVSPELARRGPSVGEPLEFRTSAGDTRTLEVVGIADSPSHKGQRLAVAPAGTFGLTAENSYDRSWLVGGEAASWEQVRALNELGMLVTSRAVLTDPPPESALPPELQWDQPLVEDVWLMVVVLIVVMVLIEVVLLAGPAFAVGARRHARTLALIAANGGTPAQSRRVVLASAVVLGGLGAVLGTVLGLALGAAALPVVQHYDTEWFGPFDVPWLVVAGVCGFGLLSALMAATVPAWIASRQDPVAVLAGRRGDPRPSLRSPLVGLVVLGLGIAGAVQGARPGGELMIASSAILSVLGMIFLVPVVVVAVARLAARLPLPLRFAARDAARHRTRTVPAVAAVAATVAGVVALGISMSSDEAENRGNYQPNLVAGHAVVHSDDATPDWDALAGEVRRAVPGVDATPVMGVRAASHDWVEAETRLGGKPVVLSGSVSTGGSSVLVAERMPAFLPLVSEADREVADRALAAGGVVVFADEAGLTGDARMRISYDAGDEARRTTHRGRVAATTIGYPGWSAPAQAVLSPAAAKGLGVPVSTVALAVDASIDEAAEAALEEALPAAASNHASILVERGYEAPAEIVVIQLVLGGLGALLMLGGTLTATFLALSDARPDLATLSAVGARPRTRRAVAWSYALVVGLVGSVLGALVGAVPGVAISYPLTSAQWNPDAPSHYLDVPWGLIAVVVLGLPLLTATIVALTARSRLPMVARLE